MRKLLLAASMVGGLVLPLLVTVPNASAAPLTSADLLTVREATTVYPGLRGGSRIRGRYGITAPRSATVDGRLRCDRYRSYTGTTRRNASLFNVHRRRSVSVDQSVVRFRTAAQAKGVLRHYRRYVGDCEGTHRTTDGEGGRARMRVRGWETPRIGNGTVGLLVAFIQHGDTTWRRTVVARTGRTVTVQEIEPYAGKGGPDRALEISRLAVAKLS